MLRFSRSVSSSICCSSLLSFFFLPKKEVFVLPSAFPSSSGGLCCSSPVVSCSAVSSAFAEVFPAVSAPSSFTASFPETSFPGSSCTSDVFLFSSDTCSLPPFYIYLLAVFVLAVLLFAEYLVKFHFQCFQT